MEEEREEEVVEEEPKKKKYSRDDEGAKPWMYILQGTHQTSGLHYEDTINVAIKQDAGAETVVARLFSTSEIHGALGDDGQNFKNVMTVLQDVFGATASQVHVKHGCAQAMS